MMFVVSGARSARLTASKGLAAVGLAPISGRGGDFSFWLAVRSRQRSHALARNFFVSLTFSCPSHLTYVATHLALASTGVYYGAGLVVAGCSWPFLFCTHCRMHTSGR
jgi:hypothetical protein